ncbi:MAG: hypothetical protein R3B96_01795 [Pirellulaceae bacterium]
MSEYDEEFRQMMQHEIAKLQSKIVYLEELYSHQERWIKVLDESVLEARKEAAHARNQNEILAVRLDTRSRCSRRAAITTRNRLTIDRHGLAGLVRSTDSCSGLRPPLELVD